MKKFQIKLTKKQVKELRETFGKKIKKANKKGEWPALMAQPFINSDECFMNVVLYPEIYVKAVQSISNIIHKIDGDEVDL